ncbi:MAG TPA: septation protein A [Ramlibacter sp.]|uniref:septation protein A n=1 Tax=Ramlibacter sp. TaxID=1917967 RepID=UPI002CDA89D1|nr:septation protein A [Ramlibacter sp.]HVZ43648.1 septation protein A [Ramlibacter sp.]
MKLLFDFLPGVVFLAALFLFDIYVATAAIMAAMMLQVAVLLALRKKVSGMLWFTLGIVLIFGGATLLLRDATFIKWKPTVIYWMFCVMLLAGPALGKNFIRTLLAEHMTLPEPVWSSLNLAWAVFLALLGVLNLFVAYNFSEHVWGLFKVFGMTALIVLFSVGQAVYVSRFEQGAEKSEP